MKRFHILLLVAVGAFFVLFSLILAPSRKAYPQATPTPIVQWQTVLSTIQQIEAQLATVVNNPLTSNLNFNGLKGVNLGCPQFANDALAQSCDVNQTTVENVIDPLQYAGADVGAQVNAAIASSDCNANGCVVAIPPSGASYSFVTPIKTGSKVVHLLFSANDTYTGPAVTTGAVEIQSSGSSLTCLGNVNGTDVNYNNGVAATGNLCALVGVPSTGTTTNLIQVDSGVQRVTVEGMNVIGNSNVTDGLLWLGKDGARIINNAFTKDGSSLPIGVAIHFNPLTNTNHSVIDHDVTTGWGTGFSITATAGSNGNIVFTNNTIQNASTQSAYFNLVFNSEIKGNSFDGFLGTNACNVQIDATAGGASSKNLFSDNHEECGNNNALGGNIDFCTTGNTMSTTVRDNTFNGNQCQKNNTSYDPNEAIDVGPFSSYTWIDNNSIIGSYTNGGTFITPGATQVSYINNQWRQGTNGETSPELVSGSATPDEFMSDTVASATGRILTQGHSIGEYTVANLPSYGATQIVVAPAALYHLGEASGNFTDSSGNGNTMTAHATITYHQASLITDSSNLSILPDGAGGYASASAAASLALGNTPTMVAWVSYASLPVTGVETIIAQNTGGASFQIAWGAGGGQLRVVKVGTGNILNSQTGYISTTGPHMIAFARDSASAGRVILDGQPSNQVTITNQGSLSASDNSLTLMREDAAATQFMTGQLDEVAVYASNLTTAQIQAMYKEGVTHKHAIAFATDGSPSSTPCTGSSTGAFAFYDGAWECASF